jgi:hypothetical protein
MRPASVNRYLLPNEKQVITVRRRPAALLLPAAEGVGGLAVALIINSALVNDLAVRVAVWAGAAFLANWSIEFFVVTSRRVLILYGFRHRTVETTPLTSMKDVTFDRSILGHMLGYGTFYLSSGNRKQVLMDYVPYPEQLYLEIMGLIYGTGEDEGGQETYAGN